MSSDPSPAICAYSSANSSESQIGASGIIGGDASITSNDVEVRLTYNTVDESDCVALGPRLGKRLNAIFREASAQ